MYQQNKHICMRVKNLKFYLTALAVSVMSFLFSACGEKTQASDGKFDVMFSVPESIEVQEDDPFVTFRIMFGKSPVTTDIVVLKDSKGVSHDCPITDVQARSFTIKLFDGFFQDNYEVGIRRDREKLDIGKTSLFIIYKDIELETGVTVYGYVNCAGKPVADVVISDGVEVVKTDATGLYQMKSEKKYGYVFVSVPGGYETETDGILPVVHKKLMRPAATREKIDFELYDAGGQSNYTVLVMGDMHLANRNNDRLQFSNFVKDVNEYVAAHKGEQIYGITLGDMTWDLYWYKNNYQFAQYLLDANKIKGVTVYHTIGNHDHDMNSSGDFNTILQFVDKIAPDYYSFNIGDVHYVILDNILCTNNGTGDRTYDTKVTAEQIAWLRKDLSFVPVSKPVVIAMHATTTNTSNIADVMSVLSGYKSVHFITGHSHKISNKETTTYYDHNSGAVCATWWWTGKYTDNAIHIGQDGTPGGYQIFNISGTDLKWQFKATGSPLDYQFRTYDRNSIRLSSDRYLANASDANKTNFDKIASLWSSSSTANEVYINIWNHDPKWNIEVTENGKLLEASRVTVFDPLHLLSYSVNAYNSSTDTKPTFVTTGNSHTFKVTASSATSTLEIKITDRFGNVYTETMRRPKTFDIPTYTR